MIAEQNGITEPVNGSWLQAICESLGITEMVNGSWIQALAQYGPFPGGGGTALENTTTVTGISYGEVYQNKGIDVVDIQITFNLNVPFNESNVYKSLSFRVVDPDTMPFFLNSGSDPIFTMGFVGGPVIITNPQMVVVGNSYDIVYTMFSVYQDLETAPLTSVPLVHSFVATP